MREATQEVLDEKGVDFIFLKKIQPCIKGKTQSSPGLKTSTTKGI